MERKSFSFYQSFYEWIKLLDDEQRLKAYDYIVTYGIMWKEPKEEKSAAYMIYILAKPHIDANNKKYVRRLNTLNERALSSNKEQNG